MGPTRFPYGQARGFVNQFQYRGTTAGDISGTATPNVTEGDIFYANNTGAVTITNFVISTTDTRIVNYEGKVITVVFLDTATRIANASPIFLQGTDNLARGTASGVSAIELRYSLGSWYEQHRAKAGETGVEAVTLTGVSSQSVDGIDLMLLNNTGATTQSLSAFLGGQVGQHLTVGVTGSNAVSLVAVANSLVLAGTNTFLLNPSGLYEFVKINNGQWRIVLTTTLGT